MEPFRRIIVTSAKGGIGKSTVSLGLAAALASRGKRVLLADADLGNRCLDLMLGMEDAVLYDLGDVMAGRIAAADALIGFPDISTLCFCPAPDSIPQPFDADAFCWALFSLSEAANADYVICDTAGSGEAVRAAASGFADSALIIATQQPASIRAAEKTALLMNSLSVLCCRLVISCFDERAAAGGERAGLLDIIDRTHLRTIGVVPKDAELLLRQENGQLPDGKSRAGRAFANIAGRICGEEIPLFRGIRKIRTDRVL